MFQMNESSKPQKPISMLKRYFKGGSIYGSKNGVKRVEKLGKSNCIYHSHTANNGAE